MSDCLFCKIVAGQVPSQIVSEDDLVVAFRDINPGAPVHILVVPRKHIPSAAHAGPEDEALLGHMVRVGCQVATENGVADSGFRLVLNRGRDAGESVPHVHLHVFGGRPLAWPPG